jgi:hypothetical protein
MGELGGVEWDWHVLWSQWEVVYSGWSEWPFSTVLGTGDEAWMDMMGNGDRTHRTT